MNTANHSEVQALHAVAAAAAVVAASGIASDAGEAITVPVVAPYELHLIALSKLRPSNRNVRKTGGTAIPELASSILRVGLLQNLTVIASPDGEHFEVVAGKRRLAALKLLAKRRKLDKNHPVLCLLVPDASARTVSLTENVHRESMSPVDELFAWKALAAEGRALEDIAADFGVTPLVVKRRLKLANVSPRLLADYQADAVSLEQLMALALTDDHAAQEAAFYEAPQWQRSPESLRDHLTHEEIDASRDAVARFVGVDAYEAAGGGVRRDLFSDEQSGVFLIDAALLDTLAKDKLTGIAEQIQQEGWGWVEIAPRATASELHAFQRARRTRREPSKAEARRIAKLEVEQNTIQDKLDDEDADLSDEGVQALHEELDRLGNELEAIEQALMVYAPGVVPMAGVVVSIDHMGGVVMHRGLMREEQAKRRGWYLVRRSWARALRRAPRWVQLGWPWLEVRPWLAPVPQSQRVRVWRPARRMRPSATARPPGARPAPRPAVRSLLTRRALPHRAVAACVLPVLGSPASQRPGRVQPASASLPAPRPSKTTLRASWPMLPRLPLLLHSPLVQLPEAVHRPLPQQSPHGRSACAASSR